MASNAIMETALLINRIFQTPRGLVSNPVFGSIVLAHLEIKDTMLENKGKKKLKFQFYRY
jgi:hypothetical protein